MSLKYLLSASSLIKTTNPSSLLTFLQGNGYLILLVLLIVEGPIVTYVAAFAASLGFFNIYYVLILSLLANFLGDFTLFSIGRLGKKFNIEVYTKKAIKEENLSRINKYLKNNVGKAIAVIKLTPLLPVPGLIFAGASGIKIRKFVIYSSIISIAYSLSMVLLGFYSGVAFDTISNYLRYAELAVAGIFLLVIVIYFLTKHLSRKILRKLEGI